MIEFILSDNHCNTLLDAASNAEENGSRYPGMTYEEGIRDLIMVMDTSSDQTIDEFVADLS